MVFMSDDGDAFFTAWECLEGKATPGNSLYLAVDRSWRKAIGKHVNPFQCNHVMIETLHVGPSDHHYALH